MIGCFSLESKAIGGIVKVDIDPAALIASVDVDAMYRRIVAEYREDLRNRIWAEISAIFHTRKNHTEHNGVGYEFIVEYVTKHIASESFKSDIEEVIKVEFKKALDMKMQELLASKAGRLTSDAIAEISKNNVTPNELSILISTLRNFRKEVSK